MLIAVRFSLRLFISPYRNVFKRIIPADTQSFQKGGNKVCHMKGKDLLMKDFQAVHDIGGPYFIGAVSLTSFLHISARNEGPSKFNDRTKISHVRFKLSTADHSRCKYYGTP